MRGSERENHRGLPRRPLNDNQTQRQQPRPILRFLISVPLVARLCSMLPAFVKGVAVPYNVTPRLELGDATGSTEYPVGGHAAGATEIQLKNQSPNKTAGWTSVQVYTAIAVVLILGGIGGYLLHSSATPSQSSSAASSTATVSSTPPSALAGAAQQALEAQTKPLLQRLDGRSEGRCGADRVGQHLL